MASLQCSGRWEGVLERDSAAFQQLSCYRCCTLLRAHYIDVTTAKFTGVCFRQLHKRTWHLSPVLCPTDASQSTVSRLRFLGREATVSTHTYDWPETWWAWLCICWETSNRLQKPGVRSTDWFAGLIHQLNLLVIFFVFNICYVGSPSHCQQYSKPPPADPALLGKESTDRPAERGARQVWSQASMSLKQTNIWEWTHSSITYKHCAT